MNEDVLIEKLIPGGQGLGTLKNGKKIFLWNVLPGEIVTEIKVTKEKTHFVEGVALKIKNESKERVVPRDECFLATSPWQMMNYEYELKQKTELVKEVFLQNGIEIEAPEIITDGEEFYYRNKMEYALYWDKDVEKIKLAFHGRGTHVKIPVLQSSLEKPEIFKRANEIINELNQKHEEARKYQSLLLRCNTDGVVEGGLFENKKPHPNFNNLKDEIFGVPYSYSPNGFFQINLPVYELALMEIKRWTNSEKVLDLYSGVGTIGLSVARDKELTLVECNGAAYEECLNNIKGLPKVRAVLAKSEEVLEYIEPEQTVILDPPRAGCDKKLIEKLLEAKPKRVIYLSCNPATQARDVKMLMDKYIINDIKTFNFFPRTPHTENLVVLDISHNK